MIVRVVDLTNDDFLLDYHGIVAIAGADRSADSTAHSATDNGALFAADFRANCRSGPASDRTTDNRTGIGRHRRNRRADQRE